LERSHWLVDVIRERGPLTVAAFMDLALYNPRFGYYARAARQSGRAGDFFTSVDVGSIFGDLLELQLAEMADLLSASPSAPAPPLDLVEAGAGNGHLSADILRAARRAHPGFYDRLRLHLVEASGRARAAQPDILGDERDRLVSSTASLPESFEGVLFANELLDALPVHQVVMDEDGLREVYVDVDSPGRGALGVPALTTRKGPLSTPALADYFQSLSIALEPGWRAEIGLRAVQWIRDAARRLRRGFIVIIDYGHEARELYSATHSLGTLTTYSRHGASGPRASSAEPEWLHQPGEQDITAHVDFTSVRNAGEAEGLKVLGFLDQTYFLMGLMDLRTLEAPASSVDQVKQRLRLKTLLLPGGLGSTMKVLIFGKGVGAPALRGCSSKARVT
jgi:SAM-dependent MidA family methyltransferase